MKLVYTDAQRLATTIQIPTATVTATTMFLYVPVLTPTADTDLTFAGHAFDLSAYRNDALLASMVFSRPITITQFYSDTQIAPADESTLALYWWNENTNAWEDAACGAYAHHPDENRIVVPICHLSEFALFTSPSKPAVHPLTVDIVGPSTGVVNTPYTFTATVNPTASIPITYTWYADGQSTRTHAGADREDSAMFTWITTGMHTLVVTATNAAGWVTGTMAMAIRAPITQPATITKSVIPSPEITLYDNDLLTYTIIISAEPGSRLNFYDPLDTSRFVSFVERPVGITHTTSPSGSTYHVGGIVTGTFTLALSQRITVSFVTRADIQDTADAPVSLANRACIYPASGTLEACTWSNEVVTLVKPRGVELGPPSATVIYHVPLTNTDTVSHTFAVSIDGNAWPVSVPPTLGPVAAWGTATMSVTVLAPPAIGSRALMDTVTITLRSTSAPTTSAILPLTTRINPSGVDMFHKLYLPLVTRNF